MSSTTKREREKPNTGTSEPARPALAEWLERQWDGEGLQKVELHALYGPTARRRSKEPIERKDYKANQPKPSKEALVTAANELLAAAQRDTDTIGKIQRYAVLAIDMRRGDGVVGQFSFRLEPENSYVENGAAEEEENGDGFGSDRLLKRFDVYAKDHNANQEQLYGMIGGMFEMYQSVNMQFLERINKLEERNSQLVKDREEALSQQADRDLARDKQKFWLDQMRDGATLVKGVFPTIVNKVAGKPILPVARSPQSLVLENFFQGITDEQRAAAFGTFDKENRQLTTGVFTYDQSVILDGVARGTLPVETLYDLMRGPLAITGEQFAAVQAIFSQDQLMPIIAMVSEMEQQQAAQTTPAPAPAPKSDKE